MISELVIATHNRGKGDEFKAYLKGLPFKIYTLEDFPHLPPVKETGKTFLENARMKALAAARRTGFLSLADDSGLEVEYLQGGPGVYSARFAGEPADDHQNNLKLLELLEGVPLAQRKARFVCVVALAFPTGSVIHTQGVCEGVILEHLQGTGGFGYDPLFFVPALGKTFAQLTIEEKNRFSHRGKALSQAAAVLAELLQKE